MSDVWGGLMLLSQRRSSDPSCIASAARIRRLYSGSDHREHFGPKATSEAAVAFCPTCLGLFYRPDKALHEIVSTAILRDIAREPVRRCHICFIWKQALSTLHNPKESYEYKSYQATIESASRLILRTDPLTDGHLELIYQSSLYGEQEGTVDGTVAMEFFRSVERSTLPRIQFKSDDGSMQWLSNPISPVLPDHTSDERCFNQLRKWIQTCTKTHKLCREQMLLSGRQKEIPTRLIDICGRLRLVITRLQPENRRFSQYATLTHRWLPDSKALLLRNSIDAFQNELPSSVLTPVFRDTITAARRLHLDYVWIDALCIIQDDAEDWDMEAARMETVYKHAHCNFGATGAAERDLRRTRMPDGTERIHGDGVGLFLSRDSAQYSVVKTPVYRRNHTELYCGFNAELRPSIESDRLMQRGWVFQERLLSPRSIYFGDQIKWECPELLANETFPEGLSHNYFGPYSTWVKGRPQRLIKMFESRRLSFLTYANGVILGDIHRMWLALVQRYSMCVLTYQSDVFPALSGLARAFQRELGDKYLAGLWRKDLIRGLFWTVSRNNESAAKLDNIAPSWSWASVTCYVDFPLETQYASDPKYDLFLVEILDAVTIPASSDPFGAIAFGYIRLAANLRPNQQTYAWGMEDDTWLPGSFDYDLEQYDYGYDSEGKRYCKDTYFLLLDCWTLEPAIRVRGIIVESTGRLSEYRRIGAFDFDVTTREEFWGFDWDDLERWEIILV
ncbi:heterokaryon incompatibility protein-domain-containing protein [Paraphoma chrysanthemicola]|uniref:Heterokaryon incompatibility protein-domain-containing protein n=1 Tax=Paraphoma chrysanthemicola TaxID=798071 RepID=A0A8K0RD46_9PLEO|nr:heterokaryon incompatibility protein-domain-containing protein [Paraphoma chrysanthemicola]